MSLTRRSFIKKSSYSAAAVTAFGTGVGLCQEPTSGVPFERLQKRVYTHDLGGTINGYSTDYSILKSQYPTTADAVEYATEQFRNSIINDTQNTTLQEFNALYYVEPVVVDEWYFGDGFGNFVEATVESEIDNNGTERWLVGFYIPGPISSIEAVHLIRNTW